ncbi:lipoprotein, putative [Oceaniovalibus guishaninsula JLT2003]|uniref:Lipoprotein, putative n=1 Tax=Oceaniovalibus guishaninsula JLT2003 TaxID=1231392 RepID=K2HGS7_9RHOB|nr:ABC-type transport auxiliary lipoprotein family protein [Oceaniovalibus guishaninsula]EKE45637.1 lipoprotein, putative [Oceaniovalibus guishaninsula JLT2003]
MRLARILPLPLLLLAACGSTQTIRVDVPPIPAGDRIPVSVASVEVREVSLPRYAGQEPIFVETPEGTLISDDNVLWADDPIRGMTEELAFALAALTPARVAAEPWPFFDTPDARVEVRITRALAGRDGVFRLIGQYYVAPSDGDRPDVARRFALAQPWDVGNRGSVAVARGLAVTELARLIARDGL